jgi:hypothetical protein
VILESRFLIASALLLALSACGVTADCTDDLLRRGTNAVAEANAQIEQGKLAEANAQLLSELEALDYYSWHFSDGHKDDTGQRLGLAAYYERHGSLREAAVIRRDMLQSRLAYYLEAECPRRARSN